MLALAVAWGAEPAYAAQKASDQNRTTLVIASEGARPPYNFLEGNDLVGFEIDLGRELCTRMKMSCSFVMQDWDDLVPGLIDHQYDAIMARLTISDEARTKIAFSDPYVRMPSAFLASRTTEITEVTPASLAGKRIGVEADSAHQAYAEDTFPQSEVVPYASLEEAILDLAEDRVDVVLAGKDALDDFVKTRREGQCCRMIADVPYNLAHFGEGVGIGLRQEDTALRAMFNKALAAVRADGTFDRIRSKYFSFDIFQADASVPTPAQARK